LTNTDKPFTIFYMSKNKRWSFIYKLILFIFIISQFQFLPFIKKPFYLPGTNLKVNTGAFSFINPDPIDAVSRLASASATLGNSRMSFRAGVTATPETAGSTLITINTTGSNADENTNNLFPNDSVCFASSTFSGCKGNRSYTVNTVPSSSTFTINPALTADLASSDYIIATQSGSLTFTFTTGVDIPVNGTIKITIPTVNTNSITNDGFPDTASSIASNGFDFNKITAADITTAVPTQGSGGCVATDWNATETINVGGASSDGYIEITRNNSICKAGSTIVVTIDSSPGIVNPAPLLDSTTQGAADIYSMHIETYTSSGGSTLEEAYVKVAPVEGVLVSTTIEETLSFQICGVNTDRSTVDAGCFTTPANICGQTTLDAQSTAQSVPFGSVTSYTTFKNLAQYLKVSTNAPAGYAVTIEEDDQLNRDGTSNCTGATPSEANGCIIDTTCNSSPCSQTTSADWTSATNYKGFGYSLANETGTDAVFTYNESSRTFSAKQLPDREAGEVPVQIMSKNNPTSTSGVFVCFRLAVSATQPAGYYFNKVKYTATASF